MISKLYNLLLGDLIFLHLCKTIDFFLTGGKSKDDTDGERKGGEITYSQASGIKMEDLINEYLTTDDNVCSLVFNF